MKTAWCRYAVLASLFWCSMMVRAETVDVAVGEWPPYISESLPQQGFLCQLVREAFKQEGIEVRFHFYPWSRAYRLTQLGTYPVTMPWFRSAERERDFYLSSALGHFTTRLFSLKGSDNKELMALNDEAVGVTRGYFYGNSFAARQSTLNLEWSNSDEQSLEKLLRGRVRYMVMDEQVAASLLHQYQVHQADSHLLQGQAVPVWAEPGYLLVRKADPDARRLLDLFNSGLRKLERTGRLAQLWTPE